MDSPVAKVLFLRNALFPTLRKRSRDSRGEAVRIALGVGE